MDAPWLLEAKRLAIGQHKRYRCCGRTPAAIVWNNLDNWSMYCHRCKSNLFQKKQYVQLNVPITGERTSMFAVPTDIKYYTDMSAPEMLKISTFLITKGVHPHMLEMSQIGYSASCRRIMFHLADGGLIGRYLPQHTNDIPPVKWCVYLSHSNFCIVKPYSVTPSITPEHAGYSRTLVLTEDYLSALKVAYCVKPHPQYEVIACLGTGISKSLRAYIASNNIVNTICMFDGDDAGVAGAKIAHKVLRPFTNIRTAIVDKCDPKDLTISTICSLVLA